MPVCPKCSSKNIIPIVFGLPGPELEAEAMAGKVSLGGCIVSPDDPEWHCRDCKHEWASPRT